MAILKLVAGDMFRYQGRVVDQAGAPFNLTGCTLWWTMKSSSALADADAELAASWTDGGLEDMISSAQPVQGVFVVEIPGSLTSTLRPVTYLYDLQLLEASRPADDAQTVDAGTVEVQSQITQRTTTT